MHRYNFVDSSCFSVTHFFAAQRVLLLEFSLLAPKMFQNIPSFSRYFEQQIHQNVSSADIEGEKKKKKSVHRTRSEDPFLLVNIKSDIQLAFYAFTILLSSITLR